MLRSEVHFRTSALVLVFAVGRALAGMASCKRECDACDLIRCHRPEGPGFLKVFCSHQTVGCQMGRVGSCQMSGAARPSLPWPLCVLVFVFPLRPPSLSPSCAPCVPEGESHLCLSLLYGVQSTSRVIMVNSVHTNPPYMPHTGMYISLPSCPP